MSVRRWASPDFGMDGFVLFLRVLSTFQSSFVIFLHAALCDVEVMYPVFSGIMLTTFPGTRQLRYKLCSFWTWKAELRDLDVPGLLHTWWTPVILLGSFDKLHLPFMCFKNSLYQLILPFPVLSTALISCVFYLLCVNKEGTTNNEYWAWTKDMIFISKHLLVYVFPVTVSGFWLCSDWSF